tara:strand:+ start:74 stop:439 length:366 start_codon:yes stop_codon:yes gene_type:complete
MKKMTANQVYKLSGSTTPFAEWIGEQKTKYGEKFIENEEFMNMAGSNFIGDDVPATKEQVVLQNSDENIEFPKGAAVGGTVTLGGSDFSAKASVSNFPTKTVIFVVGAAAVGYWLYRKYGK